MIEARNVFPLKALNAITIRDTADKVRIAEKIIEANDKAKAEVVVDVELLQLDLNKTRDIGIAIRVRRDGGKIVFRTSPASTERRQSACRRHAVTLDFLRNSDVERRSRSHADRSTTRFSRSFGNSELLANPELRISEGEKATLHIGQRIPVPVSTFTASAPAHGRHVFAGHVVPVSGRRHLPGRRRLAGALQTAEHQDGSAIFGKWNAVIDRPR